MSGPNLPKEIIIFTETGLNSENREIRETAELVSEKVAAMKVDIE